MRAQPLANAAHAVLCVFSPLLVAAELLAAALLAAAVAGRLVPPFCASAAPFFAILFGANGKEFWIVSSRICERLLSSFLFVCFETMHRDI